MTSWGWIISHRCSWITVYVSCCNAQVNLIVVIMSCICIVMHSLFVNCPAVICLPSMLFIYYGETPLVNCGPRSILLHWYYNLRQTLFSFILCKQTSFSTLHAGNTFSGTVALHHTSNPLFSARPVRLTTSLFRWGKIDCLSCVQVPRCCWHR